MVSLNEIYAARTPAGGWTKETLAKWGVPWPPKKGWKGRLIEGHHNVEPEPIYEPYYEFCRQTTGSCSCSLRGDLCETVEELVDNGVTADDEIERVRLETDEAAYEDGR